MMTQNELNHADDCAFQLRALLRTLESLARDLSANMEAGPLMQPISDIATLCETAEALAETVHDALPMKAGA